MTSRAVLITGCSTGIGRTTALHLADKGWTVYATARKPETLDALAAAGCHTLRLDVCDEESMVAGVAQVEEAEGAVGVLINNAGYGLEGAFEAVSMEDVRRQFETNVFGLIRLTQLVLAGMRRQEWGRVVNISSVGGKVVFPGGAFYHATKHAVEALSDALRMEMAPFGIHVVIVEPGLITTEFGETAAGSVVDVPADSPYAAFHEGLRDRDRIRSAYEGMMGRLAKGPDAVATVIERAISAEKPRVRYPAGAYGMLAARRVLPDRAFDMIVKSQYPSTRKKSR